MYASEVFNELLKAKMEEWAIERANSEPLPEAIDEAGIASATLANIFHGDTVATPGQAAPKAAPKPLERQKPVLQGSARIAARTLATVFHKPTVEVLRNLQPQRKTAKPGQQVIRVTYKRNTGNKVFCPACGEAFPLGCNC